MTAGPATAAPALRAEDILAERAPAVCAALSAQLQALPNEDDLSTPKEREHVGERRHILSAHAAVLDGKRSRSQKLAARLEQPHYRPWEKCLTTLRDQRRQALDALPQDDAKRRVLLAELTIIEFGPGEHEAMTSTLFDDIVAAGFPAQDGLLFRHRGGLLDVAARVAEAEDELAAVTAELAAAVANAEAALAMPD